MASQLKKRKRVAEILRAQIAHKNKYVQLGWNWRLNIMWRTLWLLEKEQTGYLKVVKPTKSKLKSFFCLLGQGWTGLHTVYEKDGQSAKCEPQHNQDHCNHWFGAEITCQDPKTPAYCSFEVKKTEEMQINYAQIKMYFVNVKIFSDEEIHTTD